LIVGARASVVPERAFGFGAGCQQVSQLLTNISK